ncbi:four helix bundle protein [candidate division TA06 bacterium]|uniref:Four helix bundle protein n=1 Tax=candidate division TA06 bacterium TaxID=2250710 RepID=A0A523UUZ9_UNCT6|nr:MAG: four helix bundle protein [candidate division TA06 bacterium]
MYELTRKLPKEEEYNLVGQMKRAAVSLTNNIAEGYGRYRFKENIQFCRHSRGSLFELIDDLNLYRDEPYISLDEYQSFRNDAFCLLKVLNAYIDSTKKLQGEWFGT